MWVILIIQLSNYVIQLDILTQISVILKMKFGSEKKILIIEAVKQKLYQGKHVNHGINKFHMSTTIKAHSLGLMEIITIAGTQMENMKQFGVTQLILILLGNCVILLVGWTKIHATLKMKVLKKIKEQATEVVKPRLFQDLIAYLGILMNRFKIMREVNNMEQMETIITAEIQMEVNKLFGVTQVTLKIQQRSFVILLASLSQINSTRVGMGMNH